MDVSMFISRSISVSTVDSGGSKELELGCTTIYAGLPSFCGLGLEEGHVPTLWLLPYTPRVSYDYRPPALQCRDQVPQQYLNIVSCW